MPVVHKRGSVFDTSLTHIGHGVNTIGVMGAGIALLFRQRYPDMYEAYRELCLAEGLAPGSSFTYRNDDGITVHNIASQRDKGADARLTWLEEGLDMALRDVADSGGAGIAVPWIGAGIGGLHQEDVQEVINTCAAKHPNLTVEVWTYEP